MQIPEMVRIALDDLGLDATNDQVADFLWERFCKKIDSRFVPIYRATLRGEEKLKEAREMAARLIREEREAAAKGKKSA